MKSIFLTGASGVGKSTMYRQLTDRGILPSPSHITREKRPDEIDGYDAFFLAFSAFRKNFYDGLYLESSLEETEYIGVYYGSPRTWQTGVEEARESFVAIPANVLVLGGMCRNMESEGKRDRMLWVNLTASLDVRRMRISPRVADPEVLEKRLLSGVSHGDQPAADMNLDTSEVTPEELAETILRSTI